MVNKSCINTRWIDLMQSPSKGDLAKIDQAILRLVVAALHLERNQPMRLNLKKIINTISCAEIGSISSKEELQEKIKQSVVNIFCRSGSSQNEVGVDRDLCNWQYLAKIRPLQIKELYHAEESAGAEQLQALSSREGKEVVDSRRNSLLEFAESCLAIEEKSQEKSSIFIKESRVERKRRRGFKEIQKLWSVVPYFHPRAIKRARHEAEGPATS